MPVLISFVKLLIIRDKSFYLRHFIIIWYNESKQHFFVQKLEVNMNFGKQGIIQKKKRLNSSGSRLGTKLGVTVVKLLFIAVIAVIVAGSCLALGAAEGIIASAPDVSTIDVSPEGYATKIYDDGGNEIQTLSTSGSNRIYVDVEDIPITLQHAFIAIEDERFYEHNGIDIKGIFRAGTVFLSTGRMSEGASTITQQLLKNNVFKAYNESTVEKIKRKIQEQYLAVKLETVMDKQTIIGNYLNTINLGNGYYGVQTAAQGYFGKDVSELSLSECAVIASITQSPSSLNPVKYPAENQKRQLKVLNNMRNQGYISQAEYDEAVSDDVYARIQDRKIEVASSTYSYFVDALIDQLIKDLMEQKGYTETQATNMIYKNGLQVYSTQNMSMQQIADNVINDPGYYPDNTELSISYSLAVKDTNGNVNYYSHYGLLDYYKKDKGQSNFTLIFKDKDDAQTYIDEYKNSILANGGEVVSESVSYIVQPQMSFTIMDQHTGQVKVIVGGRGEKSGNRTLNRAVDTMRQPGSSIKPLADYGPALDTGAITLATAIDDAPYYYPGENSKLVKNYFVGEYRGLMSVRTALKLSENVPAVKVLAQITPQVGFNYLLKFGFSTLISPKEAVNGNHDVVPSLALGGLTYGVHNIEMCAAYAAIANQGTYTQPVYYTQVKDKDGNVILDNTQPLTHTVLKKSTSWLLTNTLESVTAAGTAEAAALSNQPTAGKTGTTQNVTDKWFCGYTPYYTAAIWLGYDDNSKELSGYIDHRKMWRTIMQEIHDNLPTGSFEKPDDIVETEVCSQSGKLPVAGLCDQDPRGSQLVTEYFSKDNNPTDTCDVHIKVTICDDTGEIASANCPHKTTKIMIKKAAIVKNPSNEDETTYTTWDQEYAITEEQLSKVCTAHGGSSSGSTNSGNSSGTTHSTTAPSSTKPTTSSNSNTSGTTRR